MSFIIEFDPDRRIAIARGSGPFDLEENRAATRHIVSHADFVDGMRLLWDVRERETVPSPPGVTGWLATLVEYRDQLDRRIALLTRSGAPYGMARMIEILAEIRHFELRAFDDPAQAEQWLLEDRE